jgi:hypothetical protein
MSDALQRTRWQTLNATPFRDLLRGRVTGRLDWPARLAAAGLPAEVASLITRLVRRTRLWRLERAAVADELIAHFADAIAAGTSAADAVGDFGDERAVAKLIRRAKRRGRPLPWHAWVWAWRAAEIIVIVYGLAAARFAVGRPHPTVDYVAELAAPTRAVPEPERAWPLWRSVIVSCTNVDADGRRSWPDVVEPDAGHRPDPAAVGAWLAAHADAIATARAAAARPAMGFVIGPGGSADDPAVFAGIDKFGDDGVPRPPRRPAGRHRPGAVPPPPRPVPRDAGRADAGAVAERAGRPHHRRPGAVRVGRWQAGRLQRRCRPGGRRRATGEAVARPKLDRPVRGRRVGRAAGQGAARRLGAVPAGGGVTADSSVRSYAVRRRIGHEWHD